MSLLDLQSLPCLIIKFYSAKLQRFSTMLGTALDFCGMHSKDRYIGDHLSLNIAQTRSFKLILFCYVQVKKIALEKGHIVESMKSSSNLN